jgi:hypothetical protein
MATVRVSMSPSWPVASPARTICVSRGGKARGIEAIAIDSGRPALTSCSSAPITAARRGTVAC